MAETPRRGYLRSLGSLYVATIRIGMQRSLQYRTTTAFELLLLLAEPLVYLLVWQAVVRAEGGEVAGYDTGRVAAYYVGYALLRPALQIGSPMNWEDSVREGRMSGMLLRPMHPVHQDNAFWLGWASVRLVMAAPAALLLAVMFRPEFDSSVFALAALPVALTLASQLRNMLLGVVVGLTAFWITRIAAVGAIASAIDGLLSGRLLPVDMLPSWARALSTWLPFQWAFGFPIELLSGGLDGGDVLTGLGMQLGWLAVIVGVVNVEWARGVRWYGAVGG